MNDRLIEVYMPADEVSQTNCAINVLFTDNLDMHLIFRRSTDHKQR
jgi:hypothetical protein